MNPTTEASWLEQFNETVPLASALIIHGNVKDVLLYGGQYYPVRRFLNRCLLDRGYELIGHYDILDGLEFDEAVQLERYLDLVEEAETSGGQVPQGAAYGVPGQQQAGGPARTSGVCSGGGNFSANSKDFYETFARIRAALQMPKSPPAAFIIYFSEYLTGSHQQMDFAERSNLILLRKIISSARLVDNTPQLTVMVADNIRQVPSALYFENPRCRKVLIPLPTLEERRTFINMFYASFFGADGVSDRAAAIENLCICTEGLCNYDLQSLARLSQSVKIPLSDTQSLVKRFKFGKHKSPWDNLSREKILATPWKRIKADVNGEPIRDADGNYGTEQLNLSLKDCLKERVVGQDHALDAVETMIIRAVAGVQSVKSAGAFAKPKGVFLFSGPTGVGKTELSKALTEWLFGDEGAMLRFDMSEYNQEHSDQKLIGAPPGYVGHEQGGQLTNAVKKKPFCMILFDEVEKMHHKIWDIFLQILDDGRLTDGTGDTIHFSETVIIMTSNLGGAAQPSSQNLKQNRLHYHKAVQHFFRATLGRPEILNRIGMDNVIIFNPIDRPFQEKIIWQKLRALNLSYLESAGVRLEFDHSLVEYLLNDPEGFATNGARGVENLIAAHVINPLSRYLFYRPVSKSAGASVQVKIHKGDVPETSFETL